MQRWGHRIAIDQKRRDSDEQHLLPEVSRASDSNRDARERNAPKRERIQTVAARPEGSSISLLARTESSISIG